MIPLPAYVPALRGTEYGRTSLRHLLQMSSGVLFRRAVHGSDDVSRLAAATFRQVGAGGVDAVTPFNERVRPSGTMFSYASAETQVLGLVLRSAVGRPVADYMQEKIWAPIGAEADATWLIDRSGQEVTFCCINAVLRDYARLGLLLAHDGNWRAGKSFPPRGSRTPRGWLRTKHICGQASRRDSSGMAIRCGFSRASADVSRSSAIRGQAIFVDPASRLVMVHTAVRKQAVDPGGREATALCGGIVRELGG